MTSLFSRKQRENWRATIGAFHRWNVSHGATRSGKTFIDYYKIPERFDAAPKKGLLVLLGNTEATLERNVLAPMREIWTDQLVGKVSRNRLRLFGREAWALGADKVSSVKRIQGSSIAYCYGDEMTTWAAGVFDMLKSRLDQDGSCFDGTCNPDNPLNWVKKFLDSDADISSTRWRLDENPYVSASFKENLKREYRGTVYYDRFIEGLWVAAEGVIYRAFADCPQRFVLTQLPTTLTRNGQVPDVGICTIGVDFGGTGSAQAFQCTGLSRDFKRVYTLDEFYTKDPVIPEELEAHIVDFTRNQLNHGYQVTAIYADNAEPVLMRGMQAALMKARVPVPLKPAKKGAINDRIRFYSMLQGAGRYYVLQHCKHTIEAFQTAVWDPKKLTEDSRLDDGTYNIDTLDAQEYSTEPYQRQILDLLLMGGK